MGIYICADTTRLTFRELWRISSRLPVFLRACVNKVFGLRAPVRWAVRHDDTLGVLEAEEVPGASMRVLKPLVEEFQQLGARLLCYQTTAALGNLEGYSAVLIPPENNAVIVVAWARAQISRSGRGSSGCVVWSLLEAGTYFSTTNRPLGFNNPPEFRILRWPGATPAELARRHQQALAESASPATPIHDREQAKQVLLAVKRRNYEWNISRGVWVPLSAEELGRLGIPVGGGS